MGFEHWEVGFGTKMGWEMELVRSSSGPSKAPYCVLTSPLFSVGSMEFNVSLAEQDAVQLQASEALCLFSCTFCLLSEVQI